MPFSACEFCFFRQRPRPLAPGLSRRPCAAAHGPGPSVFTIRAKEVWDGSGKGLRVVGETAWACRAFGGLAHRDGHSRCYRRSCGARYRSGLAYASRGPTLFDGGAGFTGLRGRPSPSPEKGSGSPHAGGPRRSRQCRSEPPGAVRGFLDYCLLASGGTFRLSAVLSGGRGEGAASSPGALDFVAEARIAWSGIGERDSGVGGVPCVCQPR